MAYVVSNGHVTDDVTSVRPLSVIGPYV